ncbi:phosphatidylserine/phosphatidylglycerophosphate/cardiolipin synthase family protein [Candidatus Riflebacteria bacterium]
MRIGKMSGFGFLLAIFLFTTIFELNSANPSSSSYRNYLKALTNYKKLIKERAAKVEILQAKKIYLDAKTQLGITNLKEEDSEHLEEFSNIENSSSYDIEENEGGSLALKSHDAGMLAILSLKNELKRTSDTEKKVLILQKLADLTLRFENSYIKSLEYLLQAKKIASGETVKKIDRYIRLVTRTAYHASFRNYVSTTRKQANAAYRNFKATKSLNIFEKVGSFYKWSRAVTTYSAAYWRAKKSLALYEKEFINGLKGLDRQTESAGVLGHSLTFLFNGIDSFPRRYQLIEEAKRYIYLQTLYFQNDESGNKTVDLLIKKAEEGLDVKVIVDHYNNQMVFKTDIVRRLGASKVQVAWINRLTEKITNINHRFHQKLMVVDGVSYIVGGMNIGDEYADGGIKQSGWRDSDVEVFGPTVSQARELFLNNWVDAKKEDDWARDKKMVAPVGRGKSGSLNLSSTAHPELIEGPTPDLYENNPHVEHVKIRFLGHYPEKKRDPIEAYYIALVQKAKKEIYLESPYFFPGEKLLTAIINACRQGKKVIVLTNSLYSNDMGAPIVLAARVDLKKIVLAGGLVYEWMGKQTLHSKMGTSDAYLSSIGSYNLNNRSHKLDTELNIGSDDPRVYKVLKETIEKDMLRCHFVTKEEAMAWDDELGERLKLTGLKLLDYFY